MTLVDTVELDACTESELDRLFDRIAAGTVVVFPTDTVYGIGCSAADVASVGRVFSIKHRSPEKPLPVFTSGIQQVIDWVDPAERSLAVCLAERFWPGPLTIVVDVAGSGLHTQPLPYPEASTVGFRVPDHPGLLRLLQRGLFMAQTSLNESGHDVATRLDEPEAAALIQQADLLLRSNQRPAGQPSTVIRLTSDSWSVLRAGGISHEMLQSVVTEVRGEE